MKTKHLMLTGLAALLLTACSSGSDSDDDIIVENKKDISFVAGMPEAGKGTRTSFDVTDDGKNRTYSPLWSANEHMSVLYGNDAAAAYAGTNTDYVNKATFKYVGSENPISEGMTIVAINKDLNLENGGTVSRGIDIPGDGDSKMADKYEGGVITTSFKSEQTIIDGKKQKIDETSEILVSKPVLLQSSTTYPVPLEFKRYNAIICVNVVAKNATKYPLNGTNIKEIQLTTEDAANDFGGSVEINVNDGTISKLTGTAVSVKGVSGAGIGTVQEKSIPVYISVLPTTIESGKSFKIYFKTTDGRTYERILKAPAKGVDVPAGKVTSFNVGFGDDNLKVILDPKTQNIK